MQDIGMLEMVRVGERRDQTSELKTANSLYYGCAIQIKSGDYRQKKCQYGVLVKHEPI